MIILIKRHLKHIQGSLELTNKKLVLPEDDKLELLSYDLIRQGYNWLCNLINEEDKHLKYVWGLCKPEIWNHMLDPLFYEDEYKDYREVKLLIQAKKDFKRAINTRPDLFIKKKVNEHTKQKKNRARTNTS